ncbi:TOM1-like protein 1 [Ornithorhynchus anatinus]|uniref:TOM1-like protein 1 n=1 Tax=Ornithorhynchus anatinus TaxID=9258 RepID=UPI0019D42F89|nr:TOM1-like protein 1 [Ornithorhynchus anatinus]
MGKGAGVGGCGETERKEGPELSPQGHTASRKSARISGVSPRKRGHRFRAVEPGSRRKGAGGGRVWKFKMVGGKAFDSDPKRWRRRSSRVRLALLTVAFGKSPQDPFGTPVGLLIEKSTVGTTRSENWDRFPRICDLINTTQGGPRDAVRALKKRLSQNCNHKEIRLTLSLLDLCVRNCGPSFRALVVKKDFAKDKLTELLNPRYNLPTDIQNQILTFVMTWSQGFEGTVDVTQVKELYLDLLKKGIRFPSSNTAAGTDAPERSVSGPAELVRGDSPSVKVPERDAVREGRPIAGARESGGGGGHRAGCLRAAPTRVLGVRRQGSARLPEAAAAAPVPSAPGAPPEAVWKAPTVLLVPEQIGKLNSELDVVRMNVAVMLAILTENTPGSEDRDDLELLQKLYRTGRQMHGRITELLATVENEDVVAELIRVHENLSDAIVRCERFSQTRKDIREQTGPLIESITVSKMSPLAPIRPGC